MAAELKLLDASTTILFVDDEQAILHSLRRLMRPLKAKCLFVESPQQALEILQQQSVDIVVSDFRMPEMNGVEFFMQIANLYPEMIRILLTACVEADLVFSAINQGRIWGFINKPWDNLQLLSSLVQAKQTQILIRKRVYQLSQQIHDDKQQIEAVMNTVSDAILTVTEAGRYY